MSPLQPFKNDIGAGSRTDAVGSFSDGDPPCKRGRPENTTSGSAKEISKEILWDKYPELTIVLVETAIEVKQQFDQKAADAERKEINRLRREEAQEYHRRQLKGSISRKTKEIPDTVTTQTRKYTSSTWDAVAVLLSEKFKGFDAKYNCFSQAINGSACRDRVNSHISALRELGVSMPRDSAIELSDEQLHSFVASKGPKGSPEYEKSLKVLRECLSTPCPFEEQIALFQASKVLSKDGVVDENPQAIGIITKEAATTTLSEAELLMRRNQANNLSSAEAAGSNTAIVPHLDPRTDPQSGASSSSSGTDSTVATTPAKRGHKKMRFVVTPRESRLDVAKRFIKTLY